MSGPFVSEVPRAYVRLCETRREGAGVAVTAELGALARVLGASRPGGVFLCPGDGAGEAGAWILDGMDLASRLVVLVDDAREGERLRAALGDDLRVTVHVQDAVAFLEDVRDHRFDLIADASDDAPARRLELALARLAPGGLLLTRCPPDALAAPADSAGATFVPARLPESLGATLVARRPHSPGGRRRGGRRARAGVTPLFSSRSR